MKKYLLLLPLTFVLAVACHKKPIETELVVNVKIQEVSDITLSDATLTGSYLAVGNTEPVSELGFKYREKSAAEWNSVTATGTSETFGHTLSGLAASTTYEASAWIKIGDITYDSSATGVVEFTTLDEEPEPAVKQFHWGELPVLETMDNVVYVAHYVTSNGESDALPTDKGRVRNYTVCYDEALHQPLWVAYPMHEWYDGDAGRNDKWQYDPYLPKDVQPNLSSSYVGEYSRGHMLASSDRQRTVAMNRQTFYFSNMSPQIQNEFNGGIWSKLEQKVQDWGFGCPDTLYVVTGAAFSDSPKSTSDKSGMSLPVPDYYYKVLLSSKSGHTGKSIGELPASEIRCVGFWLSHFGYGTKDNLSTKELMSVAEIEQRTGFEFFPMLSAEAQSVKETYTASDWGM